MSSEQNENQPMVGRFYSGARNFKQVLGSFPDGSRIPGGPYTFAQFGVLVGTLLVGWLTRPLWGGDLISDVIIIGAFSFGLAILTGKIPGSRRNPVRVVGGVYGLFARPRTGVYRGRPMKTSFGRRPRRDTGRAARQKAPADEPPTTPRALSGNHSSLDLLRADLGMND